MTLSLGCVTISFNQAPYLRECIESVRCADPARLAYVMVDPGSRDGSREIIGEYAAQRRFHAVVLEPDVGPGDGLNKGFAQLGDRDILCYLNSDDRFLPGALDWVLRYFADHPEVDVLTGAVNIIDQHGRAAFRKRLSDPLTPRRFLCGTTWTMQQATFFRSALFRATTGFNPANRTCWDTELLIDLMLAGARFRSEYRLLGDYRLYPGTITHSLLNEGHSQRYLGDLYRLRAKLVAAGHRPVSRLGQVVGSWLFRLDPLRRLHELTVR